jgi:adenosine deaminase
MQTDLVAEYFASAQAYGWNRETVADVARTSIEASFCDADLRRRLISELVAPEPRSGG